MFRNDKEAELWVKNLPNLGFISDSVMAHAFGVEYCNRTLFLRYFNTPKFRPFLAPMLDIMTKPKYARLRVVIHNIYAWKWAFFILVLHGDNDIMWYNKITGDPVLNWKYRLNRQANAV